MTMKARNGAESGSRRRNLRLRRPKALRQSYIARADACMLSLRFELESHQRQRGGNMGTLGARGILFHRFAKAVVKELVAHRETRVGHGSEYKIETAMELLTEVIAQVDVPDEDFVLLPMRELRWLRVLATRFIHHHEFSIERFVEAERKLEAEIEVVGPRGTRYFRTITGTPDLLLGGPNRGEAVAMDYKTGWAPPPRRVQREGQATAERLSDMGYVQQIVYGWLILMNYPSIERVIEREFYVMADDDPMREAVIERWEMERIQDVLAARVAGIDAALRAGKRSKRWLPVPGSHCATCPRPRDCPLKDEVGIPADEEEAADLAREWHVAGEIRKDRAPLVKGWVDEYGPIDIAHAKGRRVVGYKPGTKQVALYEPKDIDPSPFDQDLERALEASLRDRGVDPA